LYRVSFILPPIFVVAYLGHLGLSLMHLLLYNYDAELINDRLARIEKRIDDLKLE